MDTKAIKIERSIKTEPTLPTKTLEQLQQWPPKQGPYFSFWCSPTIGGGLFSGLNSSSSPQNRPLLLNSLYFLAHYMHMYSRTLYYIIIYLNYNE